MTKQDYERIRNLAWDFLYKNKIQKLPLDLETILSTNKIMHFHYQNPKAQAILKKLNALHMVMTEIGILVKINGDFYIFYDERQQPIGRKLYTVAHEIGHMYCGHYKDFDTVLGRARIYKAEKPQHEKEADMFAARILAPLCVLKECNIESVEELMELTGLSEEAAGYRFNRLQEKIKDGHFYMDPLERKVYKQFEGFIKEYNMKK